MMNNINFNNFIRTYKISRKVNLPLLSELEDVIIGTALGDLSIVKAGINHNTRLQFKQSIKNKIYIEHLYSLFKDYCGTKPKSNSYFDKRNIKIYRNISFQTLALPCFNKYRDLFYQFDGNKYRKIIPNNIDYYLTSKSLAYWIMDDGYRLNNGVALCTESFTLEEQNILIDVLTSKFSLNCSIQGYNNKQKRYEIYILSSSLNHLKYLVSPYILPHFNYKLGI